ncbi:MAG: SGNH/GDSL hydrolase family protein [Phycisphaerae bacterium]
MLNRKAVPMSQPALAGMILLAAGAIVMQPITASASQFNHFVVFGDSLTDVGNLANADGGLLPGKLSNYTTGMFTDGPTTSPSTTIIGNYAYQLNNALGFSTLTASALGGTDYSYGGAVTGGSQTIDGVTIPGMQAQVDSFINSNPTSPANNLYLLWGGANDILDAAEASGATATSIDDAATTAATNVYDEISTLYQNGARDFIWLNLPNLELTPEGAGLSTAADLPTAVSDFNSSFNYDVSTIEAGTFPGMKLDAVDVNTRFNQLVADPAAYGFTNVTSSAQGQTGVNPNDYLFWDGLHPTTAADQFLVSQTLSGIQTTFSIPTPEPAGLWLLAAGLGAGALMRRKCRN